MAAPGELGYTDSSVADLQEYFRQAKAARSSHVGDWMLNLSYYANKQWAYYQNGRVNTLTGQNGRELVTDNRIMPVVTHRVSRKVKNRPVFVCTPYTQDDADVEAARIGEKVLEADWDTLDLQQKLFQAVLWADVASDGFWKIYWDSTIGEKEDFLFGVDGSPLYNPEDNTPLRASEQHIVPPEVLDMVQVRPIAPGDVCVEVISPLELFPDPLATGMEDIEWMIEEKIRSVEYVRQRYPMDADGQEFVPTPDADIPEGLVGSSLTSGFAVDYTNYKGVKVYEYWCKPNSSHPKGKRCVWINDKLMVEDSEPPDAMPYVRFPSVEVPGRFWSLAITSHLRGPQEQLNKIRTQILENAKRLGNLSLVSSRQANVEYHGVPGEHVKYDATVQDAKPDFLVPPNIPTYVENEIERILSSMDEISGIHEVSKATVPTGVTAASAINLLQEQDDTRIGPEIQAMERALEIAGTKILRLRAKFNTDERTIRIAGEEGNWDIFAFKGALLGTDPQVEVQAGSAMPRSKAAKQAAMTEILGLIFQYGIQVDQRALRRYLKNYEAGALETLFGNLSEDESQVTREHRRMIEGNAVPINPGVDDHDFHIQAHNEFQKSNRYDSLDPRVKLLFEEHVNEHRAFLIKQTNLQVKGQGDQAEPPKQSMAYKDAPPDIQRQMEEREGYAPSTDVVTINQKMQADQQKQQAKAQQAAPAGKEK